MAQWSIYTEEQIMEILMADDVYGRTHEKLVEEALERAARQHQEREHMNHETSSSVVGRHSSGTGLEMSTVSRPENAMGDGVVDSTERHLVPHSGAVVSFSAADVSVHGHDEQANQRLQTLENKLAATEHLVRNLMFTLRQRTTERDKAQCKIPGSYGAVSQERRYLLERVSKLEEELSENRERIVNLVATQNVIGEGAGTDRLAHP